MAPQTRSSAKSSPGRSTRNSIFGRSPITEPRKSSNHTSPAKTVPAQEKRTQGKVTTKANGTKGTPWLACRDAYGVLTSVAVSDTGEGVHVRWYYPEDEIEVDEDDKDVEMTLAVDEKREVTPQPTTAAAPSKSARPPFPQTPMAPQPYDAGSVIRTPVKKAKPLQPSPPRIGDKGIRCLYQKDGVLRDFNGVSRVVLRHPIGSATNLSREQVEHLENEREKKIVQVQVQKLMAEREQMEEEEFSESGYEDEMESDVPPLERCLQREGTNDTVLISHRSLSDEPRVPMEGASIVFRGPNGELLDLHGRQMLGHEGTVLIDSTYTSPGRVLMGKVMPVSTGIEDHSNLGRSTNGANVTGRPRLGPEGTELID